MSSVRTCKLLAALSTAVLVVLGLAFTMSGPASADPPIHCERWANIIAKYPYHDGGLVDSSVLLAIQRGECSYGNGPRFPGLRLRVDNRRSNGKRDILVTLTSIDRSCHNVRHSYVSAHPRIPAGSTYYSEAFDPGNEYFVARFHAEITVTYDRSESYAEMCY